MSLRTNVASEYVETFMYFDENSDRMLDLGEFAKMYRAVDSKVASGTIYTAYMIGDTNKDRLLDFDEFHLLFRLG